jgi:hypothetical protein
VLALAGCELTDGGAFALAAALKAPRCGLRSLVLADNHVTSTGARAARLWLATLS